MTNREKFNKHIREELDKKASIWEQMSNEQLLEWTTGEHRYAHIEIVMGRELSAFKLNETKAISVGSMQDVLEWLDEEAKE